MSLSGLFSGGGSTRPVYLTDHIFIIRALILRNIRLKYFRRPAGFFLEFLQPTLVCILHYFIFGLINKAMPPGVSLEQFIWGSFPIWFIFSHIYFVLEKARPSARPPFPGVTAMHMRLAICAWPVIANATFCFVSVFLMNVFGDHVPIPDVPLTALIMMITAMIAFGFGLTCEGITRVVPIIGPIIHFLPWLVFLTCGIYFSIVSLPPEMEFIGSYNPILNLIEYERHAFNPGYPVFLVTLS
jgi:ABC-type polysaccharide/polyol phosphate export permease